jgi:alkylation response protein AidB-like acyl-CoA dehydrogenase
MEFGLDAEQRMLASTVREFFDDVLPLSALVASVSASGGNYDPNLWRQLTRLDLTGLAVPEGLGGSGFSAFELCIVLTEMGRALYPGPFFATTVLALEALLATEDQGVQAEVVPRLAAGELTGTAAGLGSSTWSLASVEFTASPDAAGSWTVDGVDQAVVDANTADVIVLLARTATDPVVCLLLDPAAGGVQIERRDSVDLTRPLSRLTLAGAAARQIGTPETARAVHERLRRLVPVCQAAEQIGAAERCLEIAVSHAKQRTQFGQQIGSFQAIKHHCSSVLLANEAARWTALYASWAVAEDLAGADTISHIAQAASSAALFKAATNTIQVLGGTGYTWEHPAHLFLRRATASRQLFGSIETHRELVAASYLDDRP